MENKFIKLGLKNITYTLLSQVVSLVLSFLTAFILPIFLGVTGFGYWQVYLFYISYLALFCLGFNDGIYLRYGKYNYNELPFELLRSANKLFLVIQMILTLISVIFVFIFFTSDKKFAFLMVALNIFIMGINGTFSIIQQITNRIKLFSFLTVLNKILLLITIIVMLLFKIDNYKVVILFDIITKIIVLILNITSCKELFWGKSLSLIDGAVELKKNIIVGISLLIANLMGMLIIGIGRFIIERFMKIEVYGMYSFAVSSTNLALLFISSISLAIYPIMTRLSKQVVSIYYDKINVLVCTIIFGFLIIYFPINWFVGSFMKSYIPILNYLYILFPIVVAQGKMQLLINTYYKTLREEKAMLKANISSVIIFMIISIPSFLIFKSVISIALCTFLTIMWRCYSSEVYLKKLMQNKHYSNIIEELLLILLFMATALIKSNILGLFLYLIIFLLYISKNHKIIFFYSRKVLHAIIQKNSLSIK